MSDLDVSPSRFWPYLIARSAVLALVAAAVTFVSDHSPAFGFVALALVAAGTGVVDLSARTVARNPRVRAVFLARGAASVIIGLVAAAVAAIAADLTVFVVVGTGFAVVTAVAELLLVPASADGLPSALDRRVLAVASALLALGLLLSSGNSVVAVGLFGAWAAVTAVYSLITAFTLKGESSRGTEPVETP